MKFDIIGLMQNKMVLDALKAAPSSGIESAFAGRVTSNVITNLSGGTNRDFESACTVLGASVFALSPENPFPLTALEKVSAEQALKASAFRVYELLKGTFKHDYSVEMMFKEFGDHKGSLVGVTDPNLIMQSIVAHYAEQAAKCSSFRSYGYSDDDCYNEQSGGSGVSVIIDLKNKKATPVEGLIQTTVGEYVINVTTTRDKLTIEDVNGVRENEITVIDNTPVYGALTNVTDPSGKALLSIRWPKSRYGELNAKGKLIPQETLCKDNTISNAAFVTSLPLDDLPETNSLRAYVQRHYGSIENFNPTRLMLQERITKMTNDPGSDLFIAPAFLQNMTYREVKDANGNVTKIPCLAITQIESVYDPKASNMIGLEGQDVMDNHWKHTIILFNEQHGGEGVSKVIDLGKSETKGSGIVTLPATREACAINANRYRCVVCGKEVKKNALKQYKPKGLPEGMDSNFPGLDDSEKYKESWMCGACCDALLKQRESAVKAYNANKAEAAKVTAEQEALLKEAVEAEDNLNAAKDLVTKTESQLDTITKTLGETPAYAQSALDDAKFNLQSAETRYHEINVKLGLADNKSKALQSGAVRVLPPAPAAVKPANKNNTKPIGTNLGDAMKATATKARVVSTPSDAHMSAKDRRRARRQAEQQSKPNR